MLSNAYAENIRCLYENDEIMIVHQITNAANGTRDAVLYVFKKRMECSQGLKTEQRPSWQKTEAVCLKDKSQIVSSSPLNLKSICAQFLWTRCSLYDSEHFALI